MFMLYQDQNRICNKKFRSIEDLVRTSKPANNNLKRVFKYFPNLAILTNSSMPGEVQLMFTHTSVGNKDLGGSVSVFFLAGSLDSPTVVLIDSDISLAISSDNICLPIFEVLLCDASRKRARYKKHSYWTPCYAVLIPPFLMEAAIHGGETSAEDLLNIFVRNIT